jgi:hypothetical protein
MKNKDRSYIVILILLLITFVTSILLYRNITRRAGSGDNPVIGVLKFKNKVIERKYDSEVLWDSVESGVEIRNKDTIRSGDYSDAVLILKDDTQIAINENSMIYLDFSDGMNLNFAYGSMSLEKTGNSGESIKIVSGDKTIEVKETSMVMEKKNKQELDFTIKKGNAKIITKTEEKILETNQKAKVLNDEIEVQKVSFTLKSPENYSTVSSKSSEIPVTFEWSSTGSVNKQAVEISYESKFKKVLKTISGNGRLTASLPQGNFYWRVKGFDTKKNEIVTSDFRKLKTIGLNAARIISPESKQQFTYSSQMPIIQFSWTKLDEIKGYQLEISTDKDFRNLVKSMSSRQNYLGVDQLEPGTYYARVITEFNTTDSSKEISKPISFTIQKLKEPDPPVLIHPQVGQRLNKFSFAKGKYYFQWKDSPEYSSYQFEIANDSTFSSILQKDKLTNNQTKPAIALDKGTYFWRVRGIQKDGTEGKPSSPSSFVLESIEKIDLISPANNSTFPDDVETISFQWKKIDLDPNFVLEISNTESFSNLLVSKKTSYYAEMVKLNSTGQYFWRIRVLDESGKEIIKSDVNAFEILKINDPVVTFPKENQKVDMSKRDSLEFLWELDPKMSSYDLELYNKKTGALVARVNTKKNRYTLKDLSKLDEGEFYWTLKGNFSSKSGKVRETEKIRVPFTIYLSEKPELPNVKTKNKFYIE